MGKPFSYTLSKNLRLERRSATRGTSTGTTATRRAPSARTTEVLVAVFGLLTLLEGVEAVGEGQHAVATQGIVDGILNVFGGDVAEDVFPLSQDVKDRNGQ